MKDAQRILCISQLVRRQDIAVLQADVVLLIEESLPLDSRHVKDVQLRHSIFQIRCLYIFDVLRIQYIFLQILWQTKFIRRDEDKFHIVIARHGRHQRMDRPSEFQISAKADGKTIKMTFFSLDGQKIGQSLSRMVVSAISRIDDRHGGSTACYHRCALLRVTHSNDIRIGSHCPYRIRHAFAFRCRGTLRLREPQHVSTQFVHSRLEAETSPGGWLEEQSR